MTHYISPPLEKSVNSLKKELTKTLNIVSEMTRQEICPEVEFTRDYPYGEPVWL